jgi:hypothetical protein
MARLAFGCLALLSLPAAAAAQLGPRVPIISTDPPRTAQSDFRMFRGEYRESGAAAPNGLIGVVSLDDRTLIGVGRFNVVELARPRTNTETVRRPADVRRRHQGIAAVGISYSF